MGARGRPVERGGSSGGGSWPEGAAGVSEGAALAPRRRLCQTLAAVRRPAGAAVRRPRPPAVSAVSASGAVLPLRWRAGFPDGPCPRAVVDSCGHVVRLEPGKASRACPSPREPRGGRGPHFAGQSSVARVAD